MTAHVTAAFQSEPLFFAVAFIIAGLLVTAIVHLERNHPHEAPDYSLGWRDPDRWF